MKNRSTYRGLLALVLLLPGLSVVADPITETGFVFAFRDHESTGPIPQTGVGDNFTFGTFGVEPDASRGTTGKGIHIATSDQVDLNEGSSQGRPELIGIDIPFAQAEANSWLTPWEIRLSNGVDSASVFTPDRVGVELMEFVSNLGISGPADSPEVTWKNPDTGPSVSSVSFEVWDVASQTIITPGQVDIGLVESVVLDGLGLQLGEEYGVRIIPRQLDGGGATLSRSSNWLSWTSTPGQPLGQALQLVSASPAAVVQTIDTPATPYIVMFDYRFDTADGEFVVSIDGEQIGTTLTASAPVSDEFGHAVFEVEQTRLANLVATEIRFEIDGPAGSTILIDNIEAPGLTNGTFTAGLEDWATEGSGIAQTLFLSADEDDDDDDSGTAVSHGLVLAMLLIACFRSARRSRSR